MSAATTHPAKVTLPADDQILIEREFNAPAALVWRAVTEPDLVRRWWPGGRGSMEVCEIDFRVGGTWKYSMGVSDYGEVTFYGEFLEIVEHEKIVQTEVFAPFPDDGATNTMTLEERPDGTTLLRTLVQHQTTEARDMHINSGMEGGMQDSFDLLEQVAISLA